MTDAESHEVDRHGHAKYFLNNLTGIIEDGLLVRAWGTQRSITERKRAEEALRESEERFRLLAEEAVEGILLINNGKVIDANRAYTGMYGYAFEELIGMDVLELSPPDLREEVARRLSTNNTEPYEARGMRKDGTVFPIEVRPRSIPYRGSRIRVTSVIDLTERERTEEELKRLASFPLLNPNPVVEMTAYADPTYLNPAAERLLPDLSTLGGRHPFLEGLQAPARQVRHSGGRPVLREVQVGESYYHQTVSPVPNSDLLRVYGIDVTEQRNAEEAMREVREAERNRMARDLHDGVLQDLSYTAQAMQLTMLNAEGTGLERELQEEIGAVRRAARELRGAVYDLRLEEERDRPFPELLESLVEQNRRMAPERTISFTVEQKVPKSALGEAGIEVLRVLQEALTNIRRHSGASNIVVRVRVEGNDLAAEVRDDGVGFGPQSAPGVGLRSMRERAASLGGELEVESEPGRGTRVWLRVPMPQGG